MRRYGEEVRHAYGLEMQMRVGLNSGEVVVRAIGNDLHMDYSAVGQTTHLMGDIGLCELIDGRIVSMSPTGGEHGAIESELASALRRFVRQHRLGLVMAGEVGIYTQRSPDRVRGADIVFLSKERWAEGPPDAWRPASALWRAARRTPAGVTG
jgi:putative restriction endonuclease